MKKNIMLVVSLFSLFGFVGLAHAAAPVVTAGTAQSITLPISTVTLTGTATPTAPQTIASQVWTLTSGQTGVTIATPTALSTTVSGLTTAGSYVFKLTATDNSTPTALVGDASVTVTVNPTGTVTPPNPPFQMTHPVYKKAHKLEINGKGQTNLQGELTAINGTTLTVKVFGMTFTVDTTGVKFEGRVKDLALFKVGDSISVRGMLDTTGTMTIKARSIKDDSMRTWKDQKGREDEHKNKKENEMGDDKSKGDKKEHSILDGLFGDKKKGGENENH